MELHGHIMTSNTFYVGKVDLKRLGDFFLQNSNLYVRSQFEICTRKT
jgi:hypothetical protein